MKRCAGKGINQALAFIFIPADYNGRLCKAGPQHGFQRCAACSAMEGSQGDNSVFATQDAAALTRDFQIMHTARQKRVQITDGRVCIDITIAAHKDVEVKHCLLAVIGP